VSVGTAPLVLRWAASCHCTSTQGCGAPGENAQPATTNVSVASTIGAPSAVTAPLDGTAVTIPPCGHVSVDAVVSKPGTVT
jgi:hypothetical protein